MNGYRLSEVKLMCLERWQNDRIVRELEKVFRGSTKLSSVADNPDVPTDLIDHVKRLIADRISDLKKKGKL